MHVFCYTSADMYFLFHKRVTSFFDASRHEQKETIEKLIEASSMRHGYYVLLILATLIVTAGLLLQNTPVIIGGMIVAPIMVPLLLLSLSIVTQNGHGIRHSCTTIATSIVISFFSSVLMTAVLSHSYKDIGVWIPFEIHSGMYIFVAFCSGVAGALAWVKEDIAPSIAGVAVSVSLLPPLCAAGSTLSLQHFILMKNALLLFAMNVVGIVLAGIFVFAMFGFGRMGKVTEKLLEQNGD